MSQRRENEKKTQEDQPVDDDEIQEVDTHANGNSDIGNGKPELVFGPSIVFTFGYENWSIDFFLCV